jgi:hypothetical protein
VVEPSHHRPSPLILPSARQNHCSQKPSTDFCNKIGTERRFAAVH